MSTISRREFSQLAIALGVSARTLRAGTSIDDILRTGIQRRNIPCVTATVATADKITYQGAFGTRDAASGMKVTPDSIFAIASMTKAITSAAAMQLVEQGKITLDEPASKYLPDLAKLEVIDGFDATTGKPKMHTVRTPITLKHLLTHTSGLAYPQWSDVMMQYTKATGKSFRPTTVAPMAPLIFEPGTRWHYGFSADWTGKLVEKISGLTLEQYFQRNILQPLGMKDTSFLLPPAKFDRLVSKYDRQPNGMLKEEPRTPPADPADFNGGGGLYSTAGDYVKFMQMILRHGRSADGKQILQPKTVDLMSCEPDRQRRRRPPQDPDAGPFKRRRRSSRRHRQMGPGLPDQHRPLQRRPFRRQSRLGRNLEHVLLDRPQAPDLRRDYDAVPALRRQASRRHAG